MARRRSWKRYLLKKERQFILISIFTFSIIFFLNLVGILGMFDTTLYLGVTLASLLLVYWILDRMKRKEKERKGYYYPIIPGSDIYYPRSNIPRPIYGEMEELKKTKGKILLSPYLKKKRKKR